MPANQEQIKAVVFDLDDTLFPEREYVRSGYSTVAERLRKSLGRTDRFEDWLWDRFLAGQGQGAFDSLNESFRLAMSGDQVLQLVTVYREHVPAIRAFDGMMDILGGLRESYKLGLLTDGFLPAQKLKFQALRIERFFDASVFTEELGRQFWKPSTRGFEVIRERLGAEHAACAYVADNTIKDFLPGNQLGWRTIRFVRPGQVYCEAASPPDGEPQRIVRDGQELREALR